MVSYNAYTLDGAIERLMVARRPQSTWVGTEIASPADRYSSIAAVGGKVCVAYTSG